MTHPRRRPNSVKDPERDVFDILIPDGADTALHHAELEQSRAAEERLAARKRGWFPRRINAKKK